MMMNADGGAGDPAAISGTPDPQHGVLRVLQTKSEIRSFYNKISRVYDLLAERSEAPMRRIGLEKLAARNGETILEVGFGTGHCLVDLAEAAGAAGRVYGVDLADGMAQATRRLLAAEKLLGRVHVVCGDAEQLPYRSGSMDAVFMSFTLELFDTPTIPNVLGECKRVLRTGGRIVVVGMSKEGPSGLVVEAFQWTHRHFPNLLDCRPIFVRRALEAVNFRVAESAVEQMWVPVEIVLAKKP